MKTSWALVVGAGFALGLAACSSSQTTEGEGGEDIPVAEASTDAVPTNSSETATTTTEKTQAEGEQVLPVDDTASATPPPSDTPPPIETPPPADAQASATPPPADPAPAAAPEMPAPVEPEPAPAPAPVASNDNSSTDSYTVRHGDTLMKIAFETYGDLYQWKKIYEMNRDKLSSPSGVHEGMVLKLDRPSTPVQIDRNGEAYTIVHGDTLGKISTKVYGTRSKWKRIWHNNPQLIKNPNKIFAGFTLYYMPDGGKTPLAHEESNPAADMSASASSGGNVPAPLNDTPIDTPPATNPTVSTAAPAPAPAAAAPAPDAGQPVPRTPASTNAAAPAPAAPTPAGG